MASATGSRSPALNGRRERQEARPAWWPEGEAWPPERRGPGRISRWIGFAALGFFLFAVTMSVIGGLFFADGEDRGPPPGVGIAILVLTGIAFLVSTRVVRRFSNPIDEVLDALGGLAAGDYGVRVSQRGPRPVQRIAASLNVTAARLQAAEEQRRTLLADVAHEVRNPLAVIRGNLEGMADGLYQADPARLGLLIAETGLISRLIDDLTTLSSAEAGVLRLHPERTDLAALAREVAASFAGTLAAEGIRVVSEGAPVVAVIDPMRIRQVLENLVSNAIRYTGPGGEVRISVSAEAGGAGITVTDTGSGIPPGELPMIFERYRKSDDSPGSGLGLVIARRLVEAHGGTIRAESTPGSGTAITIGLPAAAN